MRVLLLTMNPNLGASARILQEWLLRGPANGLDFSVVLRQEGDLSQWVKQHQIPHRINSMRWPDRWKPWQWVRDAWSIARWARRQHVHLVHCYEQELYPFAQLFARLLRKPLVCHCHYTVDRGFADWAFANPRKRPAALIWISRQQKQDCVAALKDCVPEQQQHIIYCGLDLTRFGCRGAERQAVRQQWGIAPGTVVIGAANALRAGKRIDDFLELVCKLRVRHCNVLGVLAGGPVPGDEAYAEQIVPKLRAAEAGGGFRWLGQLEPIEPFMHAIDVLVSSSVYETFGMSVLEAMACRKPVAAYRGGSLAEVIGNAGVVVETGDFEGLCSGVERLIDDAELRDKLGADARQRVVDCFNPANSFQEMKAVYQSVLSRQLTPAAKKLHQGTALAG